MSVDRLISHEAESERGDRPEPFAPLRPLPPARPEAPELSSDLLPDILHDWLVDIAERMQVSLELVAIPAIVGLSAVVGRRLGIHPKAQDDWLVVPNLWGGIVARPGKMKSPTLAEALKPLRDLAQRESQRFLEAQDAAQARLESLKAHELAIKDQMRKAFKGGDAAPDPADLEEELVEARREIREAELDSKERRFIVNDSTVEKLGELLMTNPSGLLLERDELAGWLRTLERDDRRGDREFFLEAWNGTNSYTVDRIGRGTVHIPALCLSIIGGIQPTKLASFVSEALDGGYAADGLLQRFQLLVWPEDKPTWRLVDRRPDLNAREQVFDLFRRLGEGAAPDDLEPIPALRFSADAQEHFYEWLSRLEHRLHSEEMLKTPAFESHLSKYRSLMPSLALLFHLLESGAESRPVSLVAAQKAADWCGYLELHARKLYAAELRTDRVAAHALAEKIQQRMITSGMTMRDVYNAGWAKLKTPESVLEGMKVLAEFGWARIETQKTGGRPTKIVAVNPAVVVDRR